MQFEDVYAQLVSKREHADKLARVIQLKEDDERQKSQELNVVKFGSRLTQNKLESTIEALEELQMKYDELVTLYETSEPTLARLEAELK
mmetsp:Transcript_21490/g.24700  ORF Transcript_21490/g.24700 Transcript_21490/m.24700 type:complete len:89 (-) Transcript_21490:94-360(-)